MSRIFRCPACRGKIRVKAQGGVTRAACPDCGKMLKLKPKPKTMASLDLERRPTGTVQGVSKSDPVSSSDATPKPVHPHLFGTALKYVGVLAAGVLLGFYLGRIGQMEWQEPTVAGIPENPMWTTQLETPLDGAEDTAQLQHQEPASKNEVAVVYNNEVHDQKNNSLRENVPADPLASALGDTPARNRPVIVASVLPPNLKKDATEEPKADQQMNRLQSAMENPKPIRTDPPASAVGPEKPSAAQTKKVDKDALKPVQTEQAQDSDSVPPSNQAPQQKEAINSLVPGKSEHIAPPSVPAKPDVDAIQQARVAKQPKVEPVPPAVVSKKKEKPLTGREVAHRAENRPGYKSDESTALIMRLINPKGQVRARQFVRYQRKIEGEGKKTLMKFSTPSDIKDTGTLNEEVVGGNDRQHLYLPAAKKLRRVHLKQQSWLGSDFKYEDIMEIEFDDYRYTLLDSDSFQGHPCYRYEMVPIEEGHSIYGRQIRWVRKDGYLPVKNEYFSKEGKPVKVTEFTNIKKTRSGIPYAWRIVARSLENGHRTEITRLWLFLDSGLPKRYVSTRFLTNSIKSYQHPKNMWEVWKDSLASLQAPGR